MANDKTKTEKPDRADRFTWNDDDIIITKKDGKDIPYEPKNKPAA